MRSTAVLKHLAGRTGRAGREGAAVTYFTNDDAPYLKSYVSQPITGASLFATY